MRGCSRTEAPRTGRQVRLPATAPADGLDEGATRVDNVSYSYDGIANVLLDASCTSATVRLSGAAIAGRVSASPAV